MSSTISCTLASQAHISSYTTCAVRHLAHEQGLLVICTIHQPNFETFSLFDNLLVLAGGFTMFNGPVCESR